MIDDVIDETSGPATLPVISAFATVYALVFFPHPALCINMYVCIVYNDK